ncbi:MAG TPA: thioredoxin domain-containing protein, partial [Acidimicrobiales bacterium]|nr:thioredoxin domain-containing protein [Acidimicrobiales bacterium]
MTNRLAGASSAYLRQHAENPVDWWAWDREALDEAARLDRPIFLSVGYAACHWCHVMAHESFEDPAVAALLNERFVPIKVDREERPDVDALYMAATQLVSGHGGWPMSVFLAPDGRPFMAGTYYPPVERHGQVAFTTLLNAMHDAWTNRRDAVEAQASELSRALEREVSFIDHLAPLSDALDLGASRRRLRDDLVAQVDAEGGFGGP